MSPLKHNNLKHNNKARNHNNGRGGLRASGDGRG
jgi:hypothetical protein